MALPTDVLFDGQHPPNHSTIQEHHHQRYAEQQPVSTNQTTQEQKSRQAIDESTRSDVVAPVRKAPQKNTTERIKQQPNPAGNPPIEIEKQQIQHEKRRRVVPQVVKIRMQKGEGQDPNQPVDGPRSVPKSTPAQVVQLIGPECPPYTSEKQQGRPKRPVDAGIFE